jgi:hypothetical protein
LSSSLVDEDFDRFVIVDPLGTMQCRSRQANYHPGTIRRQPRTESSVVEASTQDMAGQPIAQRFSA